MKKYLFYRYIKVGVLLLYGFPCMSQNLIPNPGFEIYSNCPILLSQINYCVDWIGVEKTPDYFNSCSPNTYYMSVPINEFGYQPAHSGCGYVGIFTFSEPTLPPQWREFIQAQLISTLVVGIKYYFSFNIALCEGGSGPPWTTGSNKMGFRLSTMPYHIGPNDSSLSIDNWATFYTDSIITDTINWTTLRGSIVADSAYNYITFGNFFDVAHTQHILLAGFDTNSYYYIDDVCLSTDSLTCANVSDTCRTSPVNVGITEQKEENIVLYPNPFIDSFTIDMDKNDDYTINIYDINCRRILNQQFNRELKIPASDYSSGIYYYKITNKNGIVKTGKVIRE